MSEEYNSFTNELVCPICGHKIKYTGDSDFNSAGEIYYEGECTNEKCSASFRVYEEDNGYDLWYNIEVKKKYTVELTETYTYVLEIEASDEDEVNEIIYDTKSVMNRNADEIAELKDFNTEFSYNIVNESEV